MIIFMAMHKYTTCHHFFSREHRAAVIVSQTMCRMIDEKDTFFPGGEQSYLSGIEKNLSMDHQILDDNPPANYTTNSGHDQGEKEARSMLKMEKLRQILLHFRRRSRLLISLLVAQASILRQQDHPCLLLIHPQDVPIHQKECL